MQASHETTKKNKSWLMPLKLDPRKDNRINVFLDLGVAGLCPVQVRNRHLEDP